MIWTDEFIKEYLDKMYTDEPTRPPVGKKGTPVVAIHPDGRRVKYVSLSDAERETGINKGSISECCNHGRSKTTRGITWRFAR